MNPGDTGGGRELSPLPHPPPPPCSKADTQPFYKFDLTKFVITYRLTITFLLRM